MAGNAENQESTVLTELREIRVQLGVLAIMADTFVNQQRQIIAHFANEEEEEEKPKGGVGKRVVPLLFRSEIKKILEEHGPHQLYAYFEYSEFIARLFDEHEIPAIDERTGRKVSGNKSHYQVDSYYSRDELRIASTLAYISYHPIDLAGLKSTLKRIDDVSMDMTAMLKRIDAGESVTEKGSLRHGALICARDVMTSLVRFAIERRKKVFGSTYATTPNV